MRLQTFLALSVKEKQQLQCLDLSENNLGQLSAAEWEHFAAALADCKGLQQLRLQNNNLEAIGLDEFRAFAAGLAKCSKLQTLDLKNNNLGAEREAEFRLLLNRIPITKNSKMQTLLHCWNIVKKQPQKQSPGADETGAAPRLSL